MSISIYYLSLYLWILIFNIYGFGFSGGIFSIPLFALSDVVIQSPLAAINEVSVSSAGDEFLKPIILRVTVLNTSSLMLLVFLLIGFQYIFALLFLLHGKTVKFSKMNGSAPWFLEKMDLELTYGRHLWRRGKDLLIYSAFDMLE